MTVRLGGVATATATVTSEITNPKTGEVLMTETLSTESEYSTIRYCCAIQYPEDGTWSDEASLDTIARRVPSAFRSDTGASRC